VFGERFQCFHIHGVSTGDAFNSERSVAIHPPFAVPISPSLARNQFVSLAKELRDEQCSLRQISALLAEQGYVTAGGKPYVASAVQAMLAR
jgi:hypothetical protein